MMNTLRRLGIALGSLVAASLVVGLVGGLLSPLIAALVTVVLGGLIYFDIIGREKRSI